MRIDSWPVNKIMQLPDWCFGRRWLVSCTVLAYADADDFDISEVALPDKGVIWQFVWEPIDVRFVPAYCRLAISDYLPTSEAEFMRLEPLFNGYGEQGPGPRKITSYYYTGAVAIDLRMLIEPQGSRLCMMGHSEGAFSAEARASIVVSSLPKEVPDWLLSGQGQSQY